MRNRRFIGLCSLVVLVAAAGLWTGLREDAHPHEYASLETVLLDEELAGRPALLERTRTLRDFTGRSLDGREVDARELVRDHPVVLFTYVAEWCQNCRYEAPHLARLYWDYADRGFRVVARSEYSHPDEVRALAGDVGVPFPILPGSRNPDPENEDAVRTRTHHYRLRKALGDDRKWGTPLNLLVVDGDLDRVHVVTGEFVPEELETFLDERLPAKPDAPTEPVAQR